MIKKYILLFSVLAIVGCATGMEPFKKIMEDPHYMQYKKNLDDLEKSYLDGEISYFEYLNEKKQYDMKYTKEVRQREEIIHQGFGN